MIRCTKCLMPNTRPDTAFVDGVCSACHSHAAQDKLDWTARKAALLSLLARQPRSASGFDCIVASSGGKDSHAQVKALLDLGARPLIVTATTCMLTTIGRRNIDNLKRYASTIEVTPNQDVRKKLNLLGLQLVGDISWPEHVAIFTTPMRMAVALGIPLVFYGENPQAAYGGPLGADAAVEMTRRWVSEFGGFLGLRPADMVGKAGITADDMAEYMMPDEKAIKKARCEAHFLGQYLGPWDGAKNALVARAMGMEGYFPCAANHWDHENLDNAMTGLHDYMMLRKYGYGRACAQLSVDIRFGRITREKADVLRQQYERHFPEWYAGVDIQQVLNHLGLTREELDAIIEKFAVNHDAG